MVSTLDHSMPNDNLDGLRAGAGTCKVASFAPSSVSWPEHAILKVGNEEFF